MKIILASSSPRRSALLRKIVSDFAIKTPEIEEQIDLKKSAAENCERLALEKTRAVFEPHSLTIGGDTLGELEGKILGKPKSKKEAAEFLRALSKRKHLVVSGFCVKNDQAEITGHAKTWVTFRELTNSEIEKYVWENPVENFAVGYAIQDLPKNFIAKIEGPIENVIGLPVAEIQKILTAKEYS
ncbi:MAG: Maf family protein [Patescibacteria group bacterium]